MVDVFGFLACVAVNIVIGAIGSLVATRIDRYLQRRKGRKSSAQNELLPVKKTGSNPDPG